MKKDNSKEISVINNLYAIKDYVDRAICEIITKIIDKEDDDKYSYVTRLKKSLFEIHIYNSITNTYISKTYLLVNFLNICMNYDNLVFELNDVISDMIKKSQTETNKKIEL